MWPAAIIFECRPARIYHGEGLPVRIKAARGLPNSATTGLVSSAGWQVDVCKSRNHGLASCPLFRTYANPKTPGLGMVIQGSRQTHHIDAGHITPFSYGTGDPGSLFSPSTPVRRSALEWPDRTSLPLSEGRLRRRKPQVDVSEAAQAPDRRKPDLSLFALPDTCCGTSHCSG